MARRGRWAASHSFPPYQSEQLLRRPLCSSTARSPTTHIHTHTVARQAHTSPSAYKNGIKFGKGDGTDTVR